MKRPRLFDGDKGNYVEEDAPSPTNCAHTAQLIRRPPYS